MPIWHLPGQRDIRTSLECQRSREVWGRTTQIGLNINMNHRKKSCRHKSKNCTGGLFALFFFWKRSVWEEWNKYLNQVKLFNGRGRLPKTLFQICLFPFFSILAHRNWAGASIFHRSTKVQKAQVSKLWAKVRKTVFVYGIWRSWEFRSLFQGLAFSSGISPVKSSSQQHSGGKWKGTPGCSAERFWVEKHSSMWATRAGTHSEGKP